MKIKVVKKATKTAKPSGYCPFIVDDFNGNVAK
jgi:hypothetical protein